MSGTVADAVGLQRVTDQPKFYLEGGNNSRYNLRKRKTGVPRVDCLDKELVVVPCCTPVRLLVDRTAVGDTAVDVYLARIRGRMDRITTLHWLPPFIPSVAPYGSWLGGEEVRGCELMFLANHDIRPDRDKYELRIAGRVWGEKFYQRIRIRFTRDHCRGAKVRRYCSNACLYYSSKKTVLQGSWYPDWALHIRHPGFAIWQEKVLTCIDRYLPE